MELVKRHNSGNSNGCIVHEKQLSFRLAELAKLPSPARLLLDSSKSDSLLPPWPDAILVAEALASWIACDLKRKAGGTTELIALGRPAGNISDYDLILTTKQYGLPPSQKQVQLDLPLATSPVPAQAEKELLLRLMKGRPRPWLAVLVGGSVAPDCMDEASLTQLAGAIHDNKKAHPGSLLVLTSPRTAKRHEQLLASLFPDADLMQIWSTAREPNLYAASLSEADRFVVTSDSVSMVVEAMNTGKPTAVFLLPQSVPGAMRLAQALDRRAGFAAPRLGMTANILARLFDSGVIEAPANRVSFYNDLVEKNVLAFFPGFPTSSAKALFDASAEKARQALELVLA
jgi:mitochondrial fission protein ELM1